LTRGEKCLHASKKEIHHGGGKYWGGVRLKGKKAKKTVKKEDEGRRHSYDGAGNISINTITGRNDLCIKVAK